jgi:hypothetical protein
MGILLHSNEHLQISVVADRLLIFATCGRLPRRLYGIALQDNILNVSERPETDGNDNGAVVA